MHNIRFELIFHVGTHKKAFVYAYEIFTTINLLKPLLKGLGNKETSILHWFAICQLYL